MSSYGYTYCVFIRLISVHKIDHQYSAYEMYTMSELSNLDTILLLLYCFRIRSRHDEYVGNTRVYLR